MRSELQAASWSIALLAVVWGAVSARADWQPNGAPVSVFPCEETPTAGVADGAGGMFVFWTDNRTCSDNDLYVQRLTGSGTRASGWPEGGVPVCRLPGGQGYAAAVSDDAGGAIVVWQDGRSAGTKLYVQRVGSNGTMLWSTDGVRVCDATGNQIRCGVLQDGAGGIFVAWKDSRRGLDDGPPYHHPLYDLYAQHINAQGARTWPTTGDPVATNSFAQGQPSLVNDRSSGVLITWPDARGFACLQHLDGSGAAYLPQDGVVISGRFLGLVASDGAGGILSTFMYGPDTQQDLYSQRVDSTGTLKGPLNGVLVASAPYDQRPNDIVPDGNGGAFIAWHDLRNGQDWDVYVQRITASGAAAPGWPANGLAVCTAPGAQIYPRLISDNAGGCLLTWYDARDTTTAYDIYAQRITGQGAVSIGWPENGSRLCHASGDQFLPLPVPDGSGGALVAWSDYRVYADVYAQHVNSLGVVGDLGVIAVEPPERSQFTLGRIFPNPLTGDALVVSFSLPDASPARLSLFDVKGRCLARQSIPAGSPGPATIRLRTHGHLSAGLYLVQLEQAGRMISAKVSVVQ